MWNPNDCVRAPSYNDMQAVISRYSAYWSCGVRIEDSILTISTRSPSDTGGFMRGLGGAGAHQTFSAPPPGICLDVIPAFNWDFLSLLSAGSWPKNFNISRMVYGITIRLAGMKALPQIALEPISEDLESKKHFCYGQPVILIHASTIRSYPMKT